MNIEKPLFSIITVTLNSSRLLKETIESVETQDCDDYEYIVVDGDSSDGSLEVLEHYSDSIDRCVSEPDQGVYFAMNKALKLASGQYIYFLNAGDVFLHEKVLSIVAKFIVVKPYDIFIGSGVRCSKENGSLIFLEYKDEKFDLEFFRQRTINHQCLFANSKLFKKKKFDTSYQMLADYHWLIKQIVADHVMVEYQNIGIVRYLNEGLSNQNYELYLSEKERVLREFSEYEKVISGQSGVDSNDGLVKKILQKIGLASR